MRDAVQVLISLRQTPAILGTLLEAIPAQSRSLRRIPAAWSIHEHACHLAEVQPMLCDRFRRFLAEAEPTFTPYLPGQVDSDAHLAAMDLGEAVPQFTRFREEMLQLIQDQGPAFWSKPGHHPEYLHYTPGILLRHILMHDHAHLYRIEELWLTRDEYLRKQASRHSS